MEQGSVHSSSVINTLGGVISLEMNALARAMESVFEQYAHISVIKTMEQDGCR